MSRWLIVVAVAAVLALQPVGQPGSVAPSAAHAAEFIPPGYPDASTTGPTDESLIPADPSGRVVSANDGQILENFHATELLIYHDDVTVRNFRITRDDRARSRATSRATPCVL